MKKKEKKKNYHPFKKDGSGNIISFRFFVYENDPQTNKKKVYSSVWKIPSHLIGGNAKEIEHERLKAELTFKDEIKEKSKFIPTTVANVDKNMLFLDYAKNWANRILIKNPKSKNYYKRAHYVISLMENHFARITMKDMDSRRTTPTLIQNFYDWLCSRQRTTEICTVKKSVEDLIQEMKANNPKFKHKNVSETCGFDKMTLVKARKIGNTISTTTARAICKYFKIQFDKYFDLKRESTRYSKEHNRGTKRILITILYDAKKKGVITENYAMKDFTDPITGNEAERTPCYDDDEAKQFVSNVMKEKDIRKKVVFGILIFLGLRASEICGLEWSDINFETKELSVNRTFNYFGSEFGCEDKDPKSRTSKRTISMPNKLVEILKEYKVWWDKAKNWYGDLWANTDRLMLRENGETRVSSVHSLWLRVFQLEHGLRQIGQHLLRHTNITMQINAGVPLKTVSERAGHANEEITMRIYTHSLKKKEVEAADLIDDVFAS